MIDKYLIYLFRQLYEIQQHRHEYVLNEPIPLNPVDSVNGYLQHRSSIPK